MNKSLIRVFYNNDYGWWFRTNWRKPLYFNKRNRFITIANYKIL